MNFYEYVANLEKDSEPFAIATIVEASENSPGRTAFKMCVKRDGTVFGSIGGGSLEYNARNTAMDMMRTGERMRLEKYELKDKEVGGIGMACGGSATVLIETVLPRPQLFIFGGGHIGSALTRYATDVGFDVTVIDDRPDYASSAAHPMAVSTEVCSYDKISELKYPENSFFVIVTHQHIGDGACLKGLLSIKNLNAKYIGLIGSAKKLARVFNQMIEEGTSRDALERVYAPIGINHGGQSATEIAIAITSEIIAVRYDRELADSMRVKKHPLHISD